MSRIIAKDNFRTQNWEVSFDNLASRYADLCIGFTNDAPIIEFVDLKFKYELRQNGDIKHYGVFPQPNTQYKKTDQEFLVTERLRFEIETEYELNLWAKNDGTVFEKTVSFITPRPTQPYESWFWDSSEKEWVAPEPYPDDGKYYEWNEETQTWVEVTE